MKKIAVFLAEGFEEIEALTVVDLCRRAGLETDMVSVGADRMVCGSHGICVRADKLFEELEPGAADMLVLPGGMPGTVNLERHEGLMKLVRSYYEEKRPIGAICAAPTILGRQGMLQGKEACCYPGMESELTGAVVRMEPVVTAEHVITSRGMGCALDFALAIVKYLKGGQAADQLAEAVVAAKGK